MSQMLAAKGVPATSSTARDQFIRGGAERARCAAQARDGVGDHVPQHGARGREDGSVERSMSSPSPTQHPQGDNKPSS